MMSVERHNYTVLERLCPGDLVEFHRGIYSHWGVFVGDGCIAHLAGEENDGLNANFESKHIFTISGKTFNKARVCIDAFLSVAGDSKAEINNNRDKSLHALHPDKIVRNAMDRVGEVGYSLITKNCEHFAKWCRYGVEKSDQVDNALTGIAVGIASVATVGFIAAVVNHFRADTKEEEKEEEEY